MRESAAAEAPARFFSWLHVGAYGAYRERYASLQHRESFLVSNSKPAILDFPDPRYAIPNPNTYTILQEKDFHNLTRKRLP